MTRIDVTHYSLNGTNTTPSGSGTGGTWISTNEFSLNGTNAAAFAGTSSGAGGTWTTTTSFAAASGSPYSVDATPLGVAIGDTNQDGFADVVTANNTGNDFTLLLGDGVGNLQVSANQAITSNTLRSIITADLNGDSIPDIITINNTGSTSGSFVTIMRGLGGGAYAAPVQIAAGLPNLTSITVGNLMGNGRNDLIFTDGNDSKVGFLQNNINTTTNPGAVITTSSFTQLPSVAMGQSITFHGNTFFQANGTANAVAVGDFNHDGLLDVVVAHSAASGFGGGNPGVTYLQGAAPGSFPNQVEYDTRGNDLKSIVVGDFNNDGFLDFAAADSSAPGHVIVNYTNPLIPGTFTSGTSYLTSVPNPSALRVADFNGDGYGDLIVSSSSAATSNTGVAVLLNQVGTGFSTSPIVSPAVINTGLQSLVVTDVNQDGFADAVVATQIVTQGGSIRSINNNGGLIEIRTSNNHNLTTGDQVVIAGVTGTVPANGTWTITVTNRDRFTLNGSTFSGTSPQSGTWTKLSTAVTNDNVYVLMGNGDGTFKAATPYLAGGTGTPLLAPSYITATPSPLTRVTTFTSGGNIVTTNLITNGNFESRDLATETGNLLGWTTYNQPGSPLGSFGAWQPQSASTSPLSGVTVPTPTGRYAAMLDEYNQTPYSGNTNPNAASTYSGSHAIYQDVTIPAGTSQAQLSLSLYIDNTGSSVGFSDPSTGTPTGTLNFTSPLPNQQVRVDIVRPTYAGAIASVVGTGGANNVVITTTTPHHLVSGASVTINNVTGFAAALGTYTITVIDATHFALNGNHAIGNVSNSGTWITSNPLSVSTAAYATGNIVSAAETGGVNPIVITTSGAHGLITGELVVISGVNGLAAANGSFTVTVIDATHFALDGTHTVGSGTGGTWTVPGDVLRNIYQTQPTTNNTVPYTLIQDLDLTAFAGQTIRIRVASVNNRGKLIVGLDNAQLFARFADSTLPTLTGLQMSNPAYVSAGVAHTNDPTIIGSIGDNSGLSGVNYVEFDLNGIPLGGIGNFKVTSWDAAGNFQFTIPSPRDGTNIVNVSVVDKAGNVTTQTLTFFMQSASVTEWEAVGPQGIDVTGQGVDFTKVSGRITATVPDLSDPLGNTYFVGTVNGGIWKTTDGGQNWNSLTNNVTDASGNPIAVPIGGLAQSVSNPQILYAATGVGDEELDSRPGVGILKSTDGGATWTLIGNSATVFAGARTGKVVINFNNPNIAYVAVAAGGTGGVDEFGNVGPAGPGVYKTTDGGLHWRNMLDPANMTYQADPTSPATTVLGAGFPLDSVTDLIIDPADSNRIFAGVGDIGLLTSPSTTTGLWFSSNGGAGWKLIEGGDNAAIALNGLPNELVGGTHLGRVTVAIGSGQTQNQGYVYVLIGTPPGDNTPPSVDWGTFSGLYRTRDNMLNFTKVMLKQNVGGTGGMSGNHNFVDINLLGQDAANAGALLVDPNNANVVYVGGSKRWNSGVSPDHLLIRVDTGNMNDTTGSNDGDDTSKSARAASQGLFYDPQDTTPTDPYVGEGVYWYDLAQNSSGGTSNQNPLNSLPPAITSLAFDAQGRLLVGTVGGIWRGVGYGFSYDFTSGNKGILHQGGGGGGGGGGGNNFSAPGMTFTSINGNLQISDMTSVAIDPFNRGVYFTTQIDTGVAASSQPLVWTSQGLTGPEVNGNNLGIPSAGQILTSNPSPDASPGTPVSLFRIWQFANQLALQPETSADNGSTWSSINSTGISINATAGIFPAFAVDPNPIATINGQGQTVYQTELAFGANVVYVTDTSGTAWDAVSGSLSGTANITALAFAPSDPNAQTMYAATSNGRVFFTANRGGDNWPERDSGLPIGFPGVYVQGIAVDPNNANTVFVAYGGTGIPNHVFRSTDAGQNWTPVTGSGPNTLPNASAYRIVIDRAPGLGAPNGKIYLATEVGVFYSIDNGANWNRLGQGMPNVPVVDLKYDSTLRVLAAATLGRGVYTIDTSAFSFIADQTIDENTQSNAIPFTVNDPGLPAGSYTITATSDNQSLIRDQAIVLAGTGQNRSIQFTPVLNANTPANGVAHLTVQIVNGSFTYSQTFTVTVNFVNQLPTISNIPSQTMLGGVNPTPLPVSFVISDVETPANQLTVSVSSSNSTLVPNAQNISSAVESGTTVTITTGTPHHFNVGRQVVISGVAVAGYNGTFTITAVNPAGTTFSYTAASGLAASSGGTATSNLILTGSASTRTLTIQPADNESGTTTITINVTDTNGGVSTRAFTLFVNANAALPFSDDFNRANSPFVGPAWVSTVGSPNLTNSQANFPTGRGVATLNNLSVGDVALQTDVNVPAGKDLGLIARANATASIYYLARILNTGAANFAQIYKSVNGMLTLLVQKPVNSNVGTLRFEVAGDSLKLFYGAITTSPQTTLVAFANDLSITANGTAGLQSLSGGVTADNFSATAINLNPPSLPFTDNFSLPAGSQLPPTYINHLGGNFTENGSGRAVGSSTPNATFNMAALANLSLTDESAEADINVTTSLTQAGVVVRYSSSGFYYGQIFNTGNGFTANIYKYTGGRLVQIASAPMVVSAATGSADGVGTLRLEAVGSSLKLFYGPVGSSPTKLVNYANDTAYAAGSLGFMGIANVSIGTFTASPITLTTPTLPFVEDFSTVSNVNQLSRNWQDQQGNFSVAGNVATANATNVQNLATVVGLNMANASVQADVTIGPRQFVSLIARYQSTSRAYYMAQIVDTGTGPSASFFYFNGVTFIPITTTTVAPIGSDIGTMRFEVSGTQLKLFYGPTGGPLSLVSYGYSSSLNAAGTTGMRAGFIKAPFGSAPTLANFTTDAITLTTPALPFDESAGAPVNGNQLDRNWDERSGNFSFDGSTATANATKAPNIATVHGLSMANATVQADVTVGARQYVSLLARYQTSNGAYYMAQIVDTGTGPSATFFYFNGVTFIPIASTTVASLGSGTGTMRFEVSGTQLKLFYGPSAGALNLVAYGYSSSLNATGTTGMRAGFTAAPFGAAPTIANFLTDAITLTTPPLPFDETGAAGVNGNQLDRNWDERQGNFSFTGGVATANATNVQNVATVHGLSLGDAAVQADVSISARQFVSLIARYQTSNGRYYMAQIVDTGAGPSAAFVYFNGATFIPIATTTVAPISSDVGTMRFEVTGTQLKLFYGPNSSALSLVSYGYSTNLLTAGTTGMRAGFTGAPFGANPTVANFFTDAITLTTPVLPFDESTGTPVNGNQLDRNWDERQGNFSFTGGVATANATTGQNLATVHGLSLADSFAQADVTVNARQYVSLLARYQVSNGKYYMVQIVDTGTGPSAAFLYFNGATFLPIAATNLATIPSGTGTMRFEVAGTQLKLFYGPNAGALSLVSYAYSTSLLTAGTTGMRAGFTAAPFGVNPTIANFVTDAISLISPSLPFTDSFVQPPNTTLSANWTERAGRFSDVSGSSITAIAPSGVSIATVNTPVADSAAQIDVSIPVTGTHSMGLVARFNAATNSGYVGVVSATNGSLMGIIYKEVNGVYNPIASAPISASLNGTLRLEVVGTSIKLFYGATGGNLALVAFANDASYAGANLSGIWVAANDSVTNYNLSTITLTNPTVPFNDTFTGNAGDQLSRNWLDRAGNFGNTGSNAVLGNAAFNLSTVNGLNLTNLDVDADITLPAAGSPTVSVVLRYQANGSYYYAQIARSGSTFTATINRFDSANNSAHQLAIGTVAAGAGTLSFQAVGNDLKLFYGPTGLQSLVAYAYDRAYTGGTVGIRSSAGATLGNFNVASITLPTSQPATFTDAFAANPPLQQLSTNWQERMGNYNLTGGGATAQAGTSTSMTNSIGITNLATVNGISTANIDLTAAVNIANIGQNAVLIARYRAGTTSDTYYFAGIKKVAANSYFVGIYKVVNGVQTLLSPAGFTVGTFISGLRFVVANNNLGLYLDGAASPVLSVTDNAITAAGGVGMAANGGVKFTNFSAS